MRDARRPAAGAGPALRVLAMCLVFALFSRSAARADGGPASLVSTETAPAPGAEVEARLSGEDLDRLLANLRQDATSARRAAATAVMALGPEGVDAIGRRLAALRRGSDEGAASLVRGLHERSSKGAGPDLLEWLLAQPAGAPQARALEIDCMLRALAHAGTTQAVRELVMAASDLAGAFRPEIGRLVRGLGERAIPALIESRREPAPEVRSWCAALLSSLEKHAPSDALHVQDDGLLCDVLRAYGKVSDMEALPEILPLANSDRTRVRAAARESVIAYGQDAVWRLRESYAVLLGDPPPDGMPAADLARKLFDAYDRYRLRDEYAMMDRGIALEHAGKAAEAVAVFDAVLARAPLIDRRSEMARAYANVAAARQDADPAAARADLRRALRLDPNGPGAAHVASELRRLEGEALVAQGIEDEAPFEAAIALDPGNRAARADRERMRASPGPGRGRYGRLIAAALVMALAIAGVILGGRRRA